jgi:hypothetical protein
MNQSQQLFFESAYLAEILFNPPPSLTDLSPTFDSFESAFNEPALQTVFLSSD